MRRIAIINQKGGVGKTTTCCNLGAAIAASGRSVLLIDLDPQAHLTMHLGVEPSADMASVYSVLTEDTSIETAMVQVRENLWLVPSHIDLAAAEMELVSVVGREVILSEALGRLSGRFDAVIIDCPPSLGVLTVNGLAAVDEVLIPMQAHFLALQGVGKLFESVALIQQRINPRLRVSGILFCLHDAGTRLASEVAADLGAFLEDARGSNQPWADARIFETMIRRNIKLAECPSHGVTIFEYEHRSNGAADYARLAAEVLGIDQDQDALDSATIAERLAMRKAAESAETSRLSPLESEGRIVYGPDPVVESDPSPVAPDTTAVSIDGLQAATAGVTDPLKSRSQAARIPVSFVGADPDPVESRGSIVGQGGD